MARWLVLFALSVLAVPPGPAHAYIDPGSVGALTQALYWVFYMLVAFFALFFRHIKTFFLAIKQRLMPPRTPPDK